jgi:uncharacterized protein
VNRDGSPQGRSSARPDLETAVPGLIVAVAGARLGVVGGAGSLLATAGGPRVADKLPEEYKPEVGARARALAHWMH